MALAVRRERRFEQICLAEEEAAEQEAAEQEAAEREAAEQLGDNSGANLGYDVMTVPEYIRRHPQVPPPPQVGWLGRPANEDCFSQHQASPRGELAHHIVLCQHAVI